ncbi:MAG: lipid A phosphate methyltransferase [Cytophagaceae bacterium]|nr:lipid A phosphate methyltransferase [Cytophagaceae bacterium]|tara:strand:+ start:7300 stop:8049 length:750 start_codon:yes stop_codon:yes gene_type:complete
MALQTELRKQGDYLFKNRSHLPIIFLITGLCVFIYGKMGGQTMINALSTEYYRFICLGICLLGLAIRVLTVGHTPKNTSGRNTCQGQVASQINTTGMYSLLRHPLYLGNFFMWLGVAMLTENLWFAVSFIFLYGLYYERIMYAEEAFLVEKFGSAYLEWAGRTPAFLPNPKNYRKPKYPFCIVKVLKKEKNGLAAIFLLFWIFDLAGNSALSKHLVIVYDFWFYAAASTCVIYLLLKVIKKKNLLRERN